MRVDARHLRRGVGAHAERAAAELIDELEGLQVEFAPGARQQRLEVLEQRRHHQLEAVAARHVEQVAAQFLDAPRLGRQHIADVLGQEPG